MLVGQLAKNLAQLIFDQLRGRKCGDVIVISLCDPDRSELASPRLDVLKQKRMNLPEMFGVKVSLEWVEFQYCRTLIDRIGFRGVERGLIAEPELV